jgi:hypothetical protein
MRRALCWLALVACRTPEPQPVDPLPLLELPTIPPNNEEARIFKSDIENYNAHAARFNHWRENGHPMAHAFKEFAQADGRDVDENEFRLGLLQMERRSLEATRARLAERLEFYKRSQQ